MSILNRIMAVIVALAILAGAIYIILVTVGVVGVETMVTDWFDSPLQRAADSSGGTQGAVVALCVVVALLMLVLLYFELKPPRRESTLLVSSSEEGTVRVNRDSIELLADKTAAAARGVRNARCRVAEKQLGLAIRCQASLALGSSIPDVTSEIQGAVKENVEQFSGLTVDQVNVKAKYEKAKAGRMAVR